MFVHEIIVVQLVIVRDALRNDDHIVLACYSKSTVVRLLYRFYDPQAGRVLINGQDIRYVDIDSLRQAIGIVPQVSRISCLTFCSC